MTIRLDDQPIPYDSRLLKWKRRWHQDIALDQQNARIARETNADLPASPTAPTATLPGDERRLRGIPAIGRGVAGAINGTRPGDRAA